MVWLYLFLGKMQVQRVRSQLSTKQGVGSREQDTGLWGRLVALKQWSQCLHNPPPAWGPHLETDFLLASTRTKDTGPCFQPS